MVAINKKVTNEGEKTNTKRVKKMQETNERESMMNNNAGAPVADVSCLLCEVY